MVINIKTKKVIKDVFDDNLNQKQIREEVISKSNKNIYQTLFKIVAPISIILLFSIVLISNGDKTNGNKNSDEVANSFSNTLRSNEENTNYSIKLLKVYAYNVDVKQELEENVQILLDSYSMTSSATPGYSIYFELLDLDYIDILINAGNITLWEAPDGKVNTLKEKTYRLDSSKILYFNVTDKTIINIKGYKNNKLKLENEITFKVDDSFNYYATLQNKE